MRWKLMEYNRNPMSLLTLKGLTKRVKQPRALSVDELQSLWAHLDEDTLAEHAPREELEKSVH